MLVVPFIYCFFFLVFIDVGFDFAVRLLNQRTGKETICVRIFSFISDGISRINVGNTVIKNVFFPGWPFPVMGR